jgi:iron complex outermembrane receptor protein
LKKTEGENAMLSAPVFVRRTLAAARLMSLTAGSVAAGYLVLGSAATPASAQQSSEADGPSVEEIIVTARRREESLQDVPIAVTAFSAAELELSGATDLTALQQNTPNLTLQVARGSNSTLIAFIRGVGQQDPLWGFEPGVGLYVDDVYIARPQGAVLDIYDIERVEVLRGPQGTLYGRNTVGGAVKYVTRRLGSDPVLSARVHLGTHQQRDVILSAATPVTDDVSIGGAVALYRRDGFGKNLLTGAEHYNKDVQAFRGSLEWTPSDRVFVRLAGDVLNDDSNPRHGHREAPGSGLATGEGVLPDVYDTRGGIGDRNSVETKGLSALVEWRISDALTFKSITAWREGDTNTVIDFDTGPAVALDVPAFYDDSQVTQEFQLVYQAERLSAVGGLYYLDGSASGAFDTIVGIANLTIATAGSVETKSYAAFADLSYRLTDSFSVSVGGRYTNDDKTGEVYRQNFTGIRSPQFGNPAAVPGVLRTRYTNSRSFSEFTPRVSVSWEPSDAWTLYASWSQGFKSGGFDMRGDAFLYPQTVDGYEPETVETAELGVKTSLANGRVRLNAAVFSSDYEDQQITSQVAIGTAIASFVDNAGSSEIDGAELEGSVRFTDTVSASFQVGYIDAKFNEFITFDPATGTRRNRAAEFDFQNTPEWTAALALNWTQNFGDRGSLAIVPAVSYRDDYQLFEAANPAIDQKAYYLYDLSATWTSADGKLSVGAHGRNLGDERYRVGGYFFPGATFGNVINGFYGPPRTFTLSVGYRFD